MSDQVKSIGHRIKFNRTPEGTFIRISQRVKLWQEILILIWLLLWLMCGFFFLSQFFISDSSEQKGFILGFLGVWSFLLYKAIKILLWRMIGSEDIEITKGKLIYKRAYSGLGKAKTFSISEISDVGLIGYSEKSFKKNMESYFWNMGAEVVGFKTPRRHVLAGMQLEKKDGKLLTELIQDGIKRFKN